VAARLSFCGFYALGSDARRLSSFGRKVEREPSVVCLLMALALSARAKISQ
jgi:hypothetical protein